MNKNERIGFISHKENRLIEICGVDSKEAINRKRFYEQSRWRIIKRSSSKYQANRSLYKCLGIKLLIENNTK